MGEMRSEKREANGKRGRKREKESEDGGSPFNSSAEKEERRCITRLA